MSERQLESGAQLQVNEERVAVTLDSTRDGSWTSLSSAVLNGGLQTFSSPQTHVLNHKVPATYDGVTPNPVQLLQNFARQEGFNSDNTVGLLTAASMKTFQVSTRSAANDAVVVDAVVTAGISNARRVGVDADYIQQFGTINTVVITNVALTESALVEAYAIAIEAKCAACFDLHIVCTKSGQVAQGTGTDCTVLLCNNDGTTTVEHAGKHTLFAEMVGQAVYEATRAALLTNIHHSHGNMVWYTMRRWALQLSQTLRGARPCIPPRPMMPVPRAPFSVLVVGMMAVVLAFLFPLPHSAQILLAAVAWDRCLGEPPLCIHPVVVTGRLISFVVKRTPNQVFETQRPIVGFACGSLLLLFMLFSSLSCTWILLRHSNDAVPTITEILVSSTNLPDTFMDATIILLTFSVWILEVVLVKSCCSLQLLCTIALQMAKFLERQQVSDAKSQLSWLCSRDPSNLESAEIAGATLESLSENLSDGLVAPLFWYTLCGALGAMGYRVVNTLDSRVGYRGKYEWFGKPSARLDDILNFIPARMTALLLAAAALIVPGCHALNCLLRAWNDCNQCESPNAGWPMGAMAGLLGVTLEKKGEYCLNKNATLAGVKSIRLGQQVAQLAGMLFVVLAVVVVCACCSR